MEIRISETWREYVSMLSCIVLSVVFIGAAYNNIQASNTLRTVVFIAGAFICFIVGYSELKYLVNEMIRKLKQNN